MMVCNGGITPRLIRVERDIDSDALTFVMHEILDNLIRSAPHGQFDEFRRDVDLSTVGIINKHAHKLNIAQLDGNLHGQTFP